MAALLRRRRLGLTSCRGIAAACDTPLDIVRNDAIPQAQEDVFIRWGCTSSVNANTVINRADGIHLVNDKQKFRACLQEENLCPITWFSRGRVLPSEFPVIVRSRHHAQGRRFWVVNTLATLDTATITAGAGYYISEIINKVAEYRVFVQQGRVVWVAQKTPGNPNDVAWNVARGGRFDNVRWGDWPMRVVDAALKAHKLTGLHFSGIDVMVDADGKPYVLEANSAPSQTSPYRQQCVGKSFNWMLKNEQYNLNPFDNIEELSWRNVIHPGLWSRRV